MIIGVVFAHMALSAMHTPEDVLTYAVVYIRIYFLGMIPNLIYNMGAGILRAVGDSKRPLYFLIGSCMVNILLDLILVADCVWVLPVQPSPPSVPSFSVPAWWFMR